MAVSGLAKAVAGSLDRSGIERFTKDSKGSETFLGVAGNLQLFFEKQTSFKASSNRPRAHGLQWKVASSQRLDKFFFGAALFDGPLRGKEWQEG